jgi:tetrahydromethanopterin S-methyltransferase subunit F
MQEQQQVGKARIIGYAIGVVMFLVMAAWKYFVR